MKYAYEPYSVREQGRTPRGVRGLKSAWTCVNAPLESRTPRGVRGLKYRRSGGLLRDRGVAPLAGCVG